MIEIGLGGVECNEWERVVLSSTLDAQMAHGRHVKFLVMGRAWDFFMSPLVSRKQGVPSDRIALHIYMLQQHMIH